MKNLIRFGLLLVFLVGFRQDVFTTSKTLMFYGYMFVSVGILIEFVLRKILKDRLLFRLQVGMMLATLSMVIGIFVYGFIASVDSFGLGLMISMLFVLLLSQIIVFVLHLFIMKLKGNNKWDRYEGLYLYFYTLLFFLLHQVKVPSNYEIPIQSYVLSYVFICIAFVIIFLIVTKVMKKSIDIVLVIALSLLIALHFGGLDLNIFFLLPLQIVVLIFLFSHLNLKKIFLKTDQIT